MKKNELIKIIELVVRKEVKKQVNEIFINDNKTSLTELVSAPKDEKKFKEPIMEQYKTKPMKLQVEFRMVKVDMILWVVECMTLRKWVSC